jgi:Copper binding proteins, plastocyanin/azurin family
MAARMSAYYVIAIVIAVGAVVLSAIGLTREDFPPNDRVGRLLMVGTFVIVLAGVVALLATTHVEHPREEAAEAAAEEAEKQEGEEAVQGEGGGTTVRTEEGEFFIRLESGEQLKPAKYSFRVVNRGKIDHDLAIEGSGVEEKTPLIGPGEEASLESDLKPGKYRFYCTVPGHAESGMETDVTVR